MMVSSIAGFQGSSIGGVIQIITRLRRLSNTNFARQYPKKFHYVCTSPPSSNSVCPKPLELRSHALVRQLPNVLRTRIPPAGLVALTSVLNFLGCREAP
jgi:hypothetical protein